MTEYFLPKIVYYEQYRIKETMIVIIDPKISDITTRNE